MYRWIPNYDRLGRSLPSIFVDKHAVTIESLLKVHDAPYSALVKKEGDIVYAVDADGKTIAEGKAEVSDAAVIQAAIDHVGNIGGGKILIKAGTYEINTKLSLKSNIIIEGEGIQTILKRNFQGAIMDENNVSHVYFKDMQIHGGGYSGAIMLVFRGGCEYIHFLNVLLKNSGQTSNGWDVGLHFYGADYCSFVGVIDGFSAGLWIGDGSNYCYVKARIISAPYIDGRLNDAIRVIGDHNVVDVEVYNAIYRGIYHSGNYNRIKAFIDGTGDFGIWHEGDYNIIYATIKNAGTLEPNRSGGGFGMPGGSHNVFIINVEGSWFDGLEIGSHISSGSRIENNVFFVNTLNNNQAITSDPNSDRAGIKLTTETVTDAYIRNNIFIGGACGDNQSTPTQRKGIHITGSGVMENNIFIGFEVFGNKEYGVIAEGNNKFIDLNIHDNGISNVNIVSGTHVFERCIGYATKNSGTATIPAGSTSVTVNHGLASKPSKVLVTPLSDPGDRYYVTNITDTSFDIVIATAPSADVTFAWYAEV